MNKQTSFIYFEKYLIKGYIRISSINKEKFPRSVYNSDASDAVQVYFCNNKLTHGCYERNLFKFYLRDL